ncbi:hypothetical protein [Yinghuangia sp. YIM S09857]|uniref:hypothetical protein n=1 Tax=Yinghuangia sp. YIM S09857 TaxID=3436929 RepID=UPI003F52C4D4
MTRPQRLAVIAVAAMPLLLTACGDDSSPDAAPTTPARECASPSGMAQDDWLALCGPSGARRAPGPADTAPVGGWVVQPNGVLVSVSRVEPAPAPQVEPDATRAGATLVVVTLTVTNRSAAPYDVSGVTIREMSRVDGTRAERITHSRLPQQELSGMVAPGQTVFAQQLYSVPDALRPGFRIIVAMTPLPSALPDAIFTGTVPAAGTGTAPAPS